MEQTLIIIIFVAIFVAMVATLVAGLIAIPVLEQSVQADKGSISNEHASPMARGHGGDCVVRRLC